MRDKYHRNYHRFQIAIELDITLNM